MRSPSEERLPRASRMRRCAGVSWVVLSMSALLRADCGRRYTDQSPGSSRRSRR
jgi:hypothetical protein